MRCHVHLFCLHIYNYVVCSFYYQQVVAGVSIKAVDALSVKNDTFDAPFSVFSETYWYRFLYCFIIEGFLVST